MYNKHYEKALQYHAEDDHMFVAKSQNVHEKLPHLVHADMLEEKGHEHLAKHIRDAAESGEIKHAIEGQFVHDAHESMQNIKDSPYSVFRYYPRRDSKVAKLVVYHKYVDKDNKYHTIEYAHHVPLEHQDEIGDNILNEIKGMRNG